jgi:hypothetical protein
MAKKQKTTKEYSTRVCVPAPMPVQCPKCHGSDTVADGGVYYNIMSSQKYEYRHCRACDERFTAFRPMTDEEKTRKK